GAELIVMLAIGITIFGLIFGDFFGFDSSTIFGFRPIFSPLEGEVSVGNVTVPRYMVFTLAFGVFHLLFGMSLGVYNLVRRSEWKEAFFGPFCWAWFYAAGVFVIAQIALSGFKFSIALQNPLYLPLVFVPLLLSAWKEGGMHAMELFIQSISNTFSYLRIWALNLSDFHVTFGIFLAAIGAGLGIGITGPGVAGATTEKPEVFARSFIAVVLAEALAIYGLVVALLAVFKLPMIVTTSATDPTAAANSAFRIFAAGLAMGGGALGAGFGIGTSGSAMAAATAEK